jgi:hypothetical protein
VVSRSPYCCFSASKSFRSWSISCRSACGFSCANACDGVRQTAHATIDAHMNRMARMVFPPDGALSGVPCCRIEENA